MNGIVAAAPPATTRDSQRALRLVVLLGVVSLFADMTYEGARSITSPFLAVLGASGTVVGLVGGLGELAGYALRPWSGRLADRTHRYWALTIVGYAVLTVAPASAGSQALDRLRTRASRVRAVERDASAYLARLLEVNSTRLKNDFLQRLGDSRGQLERALRARLQSLTGSAQHALEQARTAHTEGAEAVGSKLQVLQWLRSEVDRLVSSRLLCHQPG
jgi:hypothetical protein